MQEDNHLEGGALRRLDEHSMASHAETRGARPSIVDIRPRPSIAGGNDAAIPLVSIPGERDSGCDQRFLVARNSRNRFCFVPAGSVAGSLSDP
jgi:hypothetical protein